MPGIFALFAAILGTAGNLYCETVSFTQADSSSTIYAGAFSYRVKDNNPPSGLELDSLLFRSGTYSSCQSYGYLEDETDFEYDIDGYTRTTMAFAILTAFIGCLTFAYACFGPCITARPPKRKVIGVIFLFMCLSQGISLLIIESSICLDNPFLQFLEFYNSGLRDAYPEKCEWYTGFFICIIAVILWLVAGVAALVIPAPLIPNRHQETQTVTYQRRPDGAVGESNIVVVEGTHLPPAQEEPKV
jgi:hypothetical protein